MNMKVLIPAPVMLAVVFVGVLPAADPQLLNLVMPDAKILAGVNVDQAKTSPFGMYVLAQFQAQDQHLREFTAQTGFDPTSDLHELLVASTGSQAHAPALTLARGTFSTDKINAAAQTAGATSETYKGVKIFEDPKKGAGYAFLSGSLAVAGDVASVKGAIDRQTAPAPLPAALLVQLNQLSISEDAWAISEVPPPDLKLPANGGNTPNLPTGIFQKIQQASAGVKLGPQAITVTGQLQADTAMDARQIADLLQFLANLGRMQTQNPQVPSLLKSLVVTANGAMVSISLTVPEAEAETLFQLKPKPRVVQQDQPNEVRPRRRR